MTRSHHTLKLKQTNRLISSETDVCSASCLPECWRLLQNCSLIDSTNLWCEKNRAIKCGVVMSAVDCPIPRVIRYFIEFCHRQFIRKYLQLQPVTKTWFYLLSPPLSIYLYFLVWLERNYHVWQLNFRYLPKLCIKWTVIIVLAAAGSPGRGV